MTAGGPSLVARAIALLDVEGDALARALHLAPEDLPAALADPESLSMGSRAMLVKALGEQSRRGGVRAAECMRVGNLLAEECGQRMARSLEGVMRESIRLGLSPEETKRRGIEVLVASFGPEILEVAGAGGLK